MAGWPHNPFAADQNYPPYPAQDWPRDAVPTTPDDEQPYRNPTYAVPGPRVKPNLGYDTGPEVTIRLREPVEADIQRGGFTDGVLARGYWKSTLLDLSPGLRASASVTPVATPIESPSAWAVKKEARMQVEFTRIKAVNPAGRYEIRYIEYGSTTTPENARALNAPQDITPDFYAMGYAEGGTLYADRTELIFRAPGHLRYWGVLLVIDQVSGTFDTTARFPWMLRGVTQ